MKISCFLCLLFPLQLMAQSGFDIQLRPLDFPGLPGLQSYVAATTTEGKWLLIGGRTDGLHKRQPFAAFDPDFNNTVIYVVDVAQKQTWRKHLNGLPVHLLEQLQSSNMEFYQDGNRLYLIGGYGYSASKDEFVTHPYLTVVAVDELADAVIRDLPLDHFFLQTEDPAMAVTGGQLEKMGDFFYLVGGQRFEGSYNPMGPDHGPGFSQQYTDEIRKFQIEVAGDQLHIRNYSTWHDETNLHRRDYNLVPQIFPGEKEGLTAFSGVFQHVEDLPFLNSVDIFSDGYTVNNEFVQYLNHYHTAHVALYDAAKKEMSTVFFGGISQYYFDQNGTLRSDPDVPFVNHISLVRRNPDGSMSESVFPQKMPGLLGTAAEFMVHPDIPRTENGVIRMELLPEDSAVLIGYIFGGIESTLPNVLFLNGEELSSAAAKLFAVFLKRSVTTGTVIPDIESANALTLKAIPNPAANTVHVTYQAPMSGRTYLLLQNTEGKIIKNWVAESQTAGTVEINLDMSAYPAGTYLLSASIDRYFRTVKLMLQK